MSFNSVPNKLFHMDFFAFIFFWMKHIHFCRNNIKHLVEYLAQIIKLDASIYTKSYMYTSTINHLALSINSLAIEN